MIAKITSKPARATPTPIPMLAGVESELVELECEREAESLDKGVGSGDAEEVLVTAVVEDVVV